MALLVNTNDEDKEIFFEAQLPSEAFISNFTMRINEELQVGEVKEKKAARQDYDRAKAGGHTAGIVEQKPRETDRFRTSLNVGAGKKIKFHLTYQEVLKRVHGVYKHVINILSAEKVGDLKVEVFITERGRIRKLYVSKFGSKIGEKTNKELLAAPENNNVSIRNTISEDGFATVHIFYEPTEKTAGQLAVLYDLERANNGGEIEVVDGYFVHFFSPETENLPSGATNVVFVLDKSGSMLGKKFLQLKEAMRTILGDLKPEDRFGLMWFSTETEIWDRSLRFSNDETVREALDFVQKASASGGTNIHQALVEALTMVRNDKATNESVAPNMILFLTDGLATEGEIQSSAHLRLAIRSENQDLGVKIHNLAFGNDADYKMLQQMSTENNGLARKIYEASDAKFQLEGFYSEIANPIFTHLEIQYLDGKVDVSSIVRDREDDTFYEEGEVVLLGKLKDPGTESLRGEIQTLGPDGETANFRCGNECYSCCFDDSICPRWCRGWWQCEIPNPAFIPTVGVEPAAQPANTLRGFVERMWVYMTIKKLLKEANFQEETPEGKRKKDEALRLSIHYNFVTEVTSMVVVDKQADVSQEEDEADLALASSFVHQMQSGIRMMYPAPPGQPSMPGAAAPPGWAMSGAPAPLRWAMPAMPAPPGWAMPAIPAPPGWAMPGAPAHPGWAMPGAPAPTAWAMPGAPAPPGWAMPGMPAPPGWDSTLEASASPGAVAGTPASPRQPGMPGTPPEVVGITGAPVPSEQTSVLGSQTTVSFPAPLSVSLQPNPARTMPKTHHSPTTASVCQAKVLILIDRRTPSNVTKAQVVELLQQLGTIQPKFSVEVAIVELSDSSPTIPQALTDYSDYTVLSSLPTLPSESQSYSSLYNKLARNSSNRRIVLIMNGKQKLINSIENDMKRLKLRGVEVYAYQSANDFSHHVNKQLKSITTDDAHFLYAVDMTYLAKSVAC